MPVKRDHQDIVLLINYNKVNMKNVIGYCHNIIHTGYISKNILKEHKCIEKQCLSFEKYNPDYWARVEKAKQEKRELYKNAKIKKLQIKTRNEFIHSVFEPYKEIHVTSIQEIRNGLKITYIYDKHIDLSEAIKKIR